MVRITYRSDYISALYRGRKGTDQIKTNNYTMFNEQPFNTVPSWTLTSLQWTLNQYMNIKVKAKNSFISFRSYIPMTVEILP